MLNLFVALPLSLFIWFCSVVILAAAIATGSMAVLRLCASFTRGWDHVLGGIIGALIWGSFAYIVALGAIDLGGGVVDGMITRLTQ